VFRYLLLLFRIVNFDYFEFPRNLLVFFSFACYRLFDYDNFTPVQPFAIDVLDKETSIRWRMKEPCAWLIAKFKNFVLNIFFCIGILSCFFKFKIAEGDPCSSVISSVSFNRIKLPINFYISFLESLLR